MPRPLPPRAIGAAVSALALTLLAGASSAQVGFVSEQNDDDNLFASGAFITGFQRSEFIEWVNGAGVGTSLNGFHFNDSNLAEGVTPDTGNYDLAFKTVGCPTAAPGQALLVLSRGPLAAAMRPRNFGGTMLFGKDSPFNDTGTLALSNAAGGTKNVGFDVGTSMGLSTSTADSVFAHEGRAAGSAFSRGPWVAGAGVSGTRTGSTAAGATITHPVLGASASSPGVKNDGSSWVTPIQSVAKVAGAGTVAGSGNAWLIDFGTVNKGDLIATSLSIGNAGGLGGVLSALGAAAAVGDVSIIGGAGQQLFLLGGESTNNYGALGTINGYNYSDGDFASNLSFMLDTSSPGIKSGVYTLTVRDGYSIFNGLTASPLLDGGTLTIGFRAEVVPAPGAAALLGLGGVLVARRRRR